MHPINHSRQRGRPVPIWIVGAGLAAVAFGGCAPRPPAAPPIADTWRGALMAGGLSVPSQWELHADGTQSVTLTLPQGTLTSEGTFTFHDDTLSLRTLGRTVRLAGQKRTMPLVNPLEVAYGCRVSGDTLVLTRPQAHETITLIREKP